MASPLPSSTTPPTSHGGRAPSTPPTSARGRAPSTVDSARSEASDRQRRELERRRQTPSSREPLELMGRESTLLCTPASLGGVFGNASTAERSSRIRREASERLARERERLLTTSRQSRLDLDLAGEEAETASSSTAVVEQEEEVVVVVEQEEEAVVVERRRSPAAREDDRDKENAPPREPLPPPVAASRAPLGGLTAVSSPPPEEEEEEVEDRRGSAWTTASSFMGAPDVDDLAQSAARWSLGSASLGFLSPKRDSAQAPSSRRTVSPKSKPPRHPSSVRFSTSPPRQRQQVVRNSESARQIIQSTASQLLDKVVWVLPDRLAATVRLIVPPTKDRSWRLGVELLQPNAEGGDGLLKDDHGNRRASFECQPGRSLFIEPERVELVSYEDLCTLPPPPPPEYYHEQEDDRASSFGGGGLLEDRGTPPLPEPRKVPSWAGEDAVQLSMQAAEQPPYELTTCVRDTPALDAIFGRESLKNNCRETGDWSRDVWDFPSEPTKQQQQQKPVV